MSSVTLPEGPIENYYPAVVSYSLYNKYRIEAQRRKPTLHERKGHPNSNLVSRLGRCTICGDSLNLTRNNNGHDYLRCASARQKQCANTMSFPYHSLEPLLLVFDDLVEIISRLAPKSEADALIVKRVSRLKGAVSRAKARLATDASAGKQPVSPQMARQRGRIARLEDQLLVAEAEAYRTSVADRKGPLVRLKTTKAQAQSSDAAKRHLAREELSAALRELIEGVVLHEDRTLTVHSKADGFGCRIVCALSPDGLQGIQVKTPEERTGFVGASIFRGIMRSVRRTRRGEDGSTDKPLWQFVDIERLIRRVHVIQLPSGDWQAMASEEVQIDELVRQGQHALTFRPRLIHRRSPAYGAGDDAAHFVSPYPLRPDD